MTPTYPATRDIVLIGGGHTHALVLKAWGMDPLPGARLTLVNPGPTAPYTGMLPGFVAGHYDRDTLEIDLVRLARFAGARLILGPATAIDRVAREITVDDVHLGPRTIGYDIAALDIGVHSRMPDLPGFDEHAVPAKPLARLAERWAAWRAEGDRDAGMAVIGGGIAGVELAMAMAHGIGGAPVTVIERGTALSGIGARGARRLRAELDRKGIALIENAEIARVTADTVELSDGRRIAAGFVTGAAGARPHGWLAESGLDLRDGFVTVDRHLRSSDPAIFAAGDCAHLAHAPRPKAGVYAVRAAPVLTANLRAAVGAGRRRAFRPQGDYLKLVSLGGKAALAERGGIGVTGRWLWHWKDRIDRAFMDKLSDLDMAAPEPPRRAAKGLAPLLAQAPCGGCGAKVGRGTLTPALARLPAPARDDVVRGTGDDAAILRFGNTLQVLTADQLRAFTDDPGLLARIAALHALGDVHAMGAAPQAALSLLTLPRAAGRVEGRILQEILAAAAPVFGAAGAAIVGGHSATGAEMQVGFAVTGLAEAPMTLSGARPGDTLILTKPLGTGVVLAAEMAGAARGPDVAAAWAAMATDGCAAAAALRDARALTDVTGFGLAGHLAALCEASGVGARLDAAALPLLPGATALLDAGHRSTLHAANRAAAPIAPEDADRAEILFDPQTAGGFLAALADPEAALARLSRAGAQGWRIGRITDGPPRITLA